MSPRLRWSAALGSCYVLFLATGSAYGQSKSGVSPQAISLPSGPGSIEGLGESFQPQLNTGVATYRVALKVPPGVAGHQPSLALSYNAGFGNGPFGPGWALGVPAISRQTDKGQPTYTSADRFIDSSAEELILLSDGTYRRKNELDGQFARIQRLGDGWQLQTKAGQLFKFGQYPSAQDSSHSSRISRNNTTFDETITWLVDEIQDTSGNSIYFYYSAYPSDSPGMLYLTEVRYAVSGNSYHSVQFDYVVRSDRAQPTANPPIAGLADYRSGFRQIVGRRCTAARIYTNGQPVRRYTFDYSLTSADDPAPPPANSVSTNVSRLRKVTEWDRTFTNYLPPLTFSYSAFVPTSAQIRTFTNTPGWNIFAAGGTSSGIELFDVNGDCLPDLVNSATAGPWAYVLNNGDNSFTPQSPQQMMQNSPSISLASSSAQIFDLNGDTMPDFINKGATTFKYRYYQRDSQGNPTWGPDMDFTVMPQGTQPPDFNDRDSAPIDLDFDKDIDVLRFDSSGETVWLQDSGTWTTVHRNWFDPAVAPIAVISTNVHLSNAQYRLVDTNGDRLLDLVSVVYNTGGLGTLEVRFWPSIGRGAFDSLVRMDLTPFNEQGPNVVSNVQLFDVNGDGLADLVYQRSGQPGQLHLWLNNGDGTWSSQISINTPAYDSTNTALRPADMNGDGAVDLLYNHSSGNPALAYQYLDFNPNGLPNQLIAIDNGIGNRTHITYSSVTSFMLAAKNANPPRPWTLLCPFGMQVVSQYFVEFGLDLDGVPGNDQYITDIVYRDSYYDPLEKQFRGFGFVKKINRGDENFGNSSVSGPGTITRIAFHTGAPDGIDNDGDGRIDEYNTISGREEEPLKGLTLYSETTGITDAGNESYPYNDADFLSDALVYSRTVNSLFIKRIHAASGGELPQTPVDPNSEVRFPFVQSVRTEVTELAAAPKVKLLKTYDYDPYGNLLAEMDYGVNDTDSTLDDERKTTMEYQYDTTNWILNRPTRIVISDENDVWAKETRNSYDSRGLLTQEDHWVSAAGPSIPFSRMTYAANGNLSTLTNARGFTRTITYDPTLNIYPVQESIEVGNGNPPLVVHASYDFGFGIVTGSIDFNGQTSTYGYDSFGRLVSIVRPGDSTALPTTSYEYTIGDAIRGVKYAYDATGVLTVTQNAPGSVVNRVRTFQRENFGSSGVVESRKYTDGLGRVLSTWIEHDNGFAVTAASLYNSRGQPRTSFVPYIANGSFVADASSPHSDLTYDPAGRLVLTVLPPDQNGTRHQESVQYLPLKKIGSDADDNDPASPHFSTPKTMIYDGLGRLIQLVEINQIGASPGNYSTTYTYNLRDDLLTIVDAQNNVKTMTYDGLNRKLTTNDPDRGFYQYTYDDTSNVIGTLDAKGQHIVYTYDGSNRLLTEDYGDDGVDVRYHYDLASPDYPQMQNLTGRLSFVEDLSGAEFMGYDARGNPIKSVKRIRRQNGLFQDFTTISRFDAMDRSYEMVYPDGETLRYRYNNRGLLSTVPGIVTSLTYLPSGQKQSCSLANGTATMMNYDPRTRLRSMSTTSPAAGVIQDLTYNLDGANNITSINDNRSGLQPTDPRNLSAAYQYDDLYRLTQAAGGGFGTIDYAYDKIGNMTAMSSPDNADPRVNLGFISHGGSAGASGRQPRLVGDPAGPHALSSTSSGSTVQYDDLGNMVINHDDGYVYDFRNRLIRVDTHDGKTLRFSYDHADRRVLKTVDDNPSEEVVYVGPHTEIRGNLLIKFVFAAGQRVARIEGPLPAAMGTMTQLVVLTPGWNHVPLTVQSASSDPANVLSSISGLFDGCYHLGSVDWLAYQPGGSGNTLTALVPGQAYWIHATQQCTLSITGSAYQAASENLATGWNQIVFPGRGTHDLQSIVSQNSLILSIWGYLGDPPAWASLIAGMPSWLSTMPTAISGNPALVYASGATALSPSALSTRVFFYHPDHLGSSDLVTDELGTVVEESAFYPFGALRHRVIPGSNTYHSEYTYTGKELDEPTGLMYFETRFYDPVLSTFTIADSLVVHSPTQDDLSGSQFFHPYAYCGNCPIVCTDPSGQVFGIDDAIIAAFVIGAFVGASEAAINGGNLFQILTAALIGGVTSAVSAGTGGFGLQGALGAIGISGIGYVAVATGLGYVMSGLTSGNWSLGAYFTRFSTIVSLGMSITSYLGQRPGAGVPDTNATKKPTVSLGDVDLPDPIPTIDDFSKGGDLYASNDIGGGSGRATMRFDKSNPGKELCVTSAKGEQRCFPASNKPDSTSAADVKGGLKAGHYGFSHWGSSGGAFGTKNNWVLDYNDNGARGLGVQAGRTWDYWTHGCIRTTQEAQNLIHLWKPDSITIAP